MEHLRTAHIILVIEVRYKQNDVLIIKKVQELHTKLVLLSKSFKFILNYVRLIVKLNVLPEILRQFQITKYFILTISIWVEENKIKSLSFIAKIIDFNILIIFIALLNTQRQEYI